MEYNVKEITKILFEQGLEITREVLEEKLQDAYNQGRKDSFIEKIDETIDNIHYNTLMEVKRRKQMLYKKYFYNKPNEDAIIEMKALEYIENHISGIITEYKGK